MPPPICGSFSRDKKIRMPIRSLVVPNVGHTGGLVRIDVYKQPKSARETATIPQSDNKTMKTNAFESGYKHPSQHKHPCQPERSFKISCLTRFSVMCHMPAVVHVSYILLVGKPEGGNWLNSTKSWTNCVFVELMFLAAATSGCKRICRQRCVKPYAFKTASWLSRDLPGPGAVISRAKVFPRCSASNPTCENAPAKR